MTITPPGPAARATVRRRPVRHHGLDAHWDEVQLFIRYREHGDREARDALVERYLPLARELARRFRDTGEPLDDLAQVAALALIKAIDRFDPARGTAVSSYAAPTILGELRRHIRDTGWSLHVSRGLQERAWEVSRAAETLANQLGRSPTPRELAEAVGCTVEEVLEAQEAATSYAAASLDAPVAGHDDAEGLVEALGAEDDSYARVDDRDAIARGWRLLTDVDREVLKLRFSQGLSQSEIGKRVGYSQMHVSRLLRRALDQLKAAAVDGQAREGNAALARMTLPGRSS
jgi:RNA polymerase sigma-B factor